MRTRMVLLSAALLGTGCLTSGMYRTAHVLPEGEGDLSFNFNVVRASVEAPEGSTGTTSFTYPNVVPEISYHFGAAPDVEVGGRIAPGAGMFEFDVKYRFLRGEALHLAVQPAVGYRSMIFIEGIHGTLPLVLTQDVKPGMSVNAALFGTFTHFTTTSDFDSDDDVDFRGDNLMIGGALGIEFQSRSGFHFMPAFEVQRSVYRGGDAEGAPDITAIIFGVTMGFGADERMRKVDTQLDRMERKLDRPPPPAPPADR